MYMSMSNSAPEKIYLQVCGDCNANDCENCKFEDLEENITWCKDKIFVKDIEYTRTDAFIERACDWLRTHSEMDFFELIPVGNYCGAGNLNKKKMIEDFRNYMKGE